MGVAAVNHNPSQTKSKRVRLAAASIILGSTMIGAPLVAGAQSEDLVPATTDTSAPVAAAVDDALVPADVASENIKFTYVPTESTASCISRSQAFGTFPRILDPQWSNRAIPTDATWTLEINAPAPLCSPVAATAVIYDMKTTNQWPQTLSETLDVVFKGAGTYTIEFTKVCRRVQFDLTDGRNPEQLNTGFDHTLLFPGDLGTAHQHLGRAADCEEPITTTSTTAVSPTSATARTTVAVVDSATTIPNDVRAATTVAPGSNGKVGAELAATGSDNVWLAVFGAGLIFLGAALTMGRRRVGDA